ncbi:MAG: hypothetical protein S4CHLAM81_12770 [Chlamydiales bacterium]|nr:hypothetical protein [Chlamydiales bacterium]MCH9636052.1 hypothetical protein [Chlamydiales bacterium]MCH9703999.1 hypothetical protein [Chlamydiota bacterium]
MIARATLLFLILLAGCAKHQPKTCSDHLDDILSQFTDEQQAEHFSVVVTGGGAGKDNIRVLKASFETYEVLTVEKGREQIIRMSDQLVEMINTNPVYRNCFASSEPIEMRFDLAIHGSDPKHKGQDFITAVSLYHGTVRYFLIDLSNSDDGDGVVHEETYEEAVEILQGSRKAAQPPCGTQCH